METPFQKILELIVQPPGNLIYHLALAFSVLSSLQAAIISRQSSRQPHTRRMVFGLSMLLLGQLILFFSSGFAWQGILNQSAFMPPLDRAVMVFSLVWIVWLWGFPNPSKLGDLLAGFLSLGAVLLFLFTYTTWSASGAGTPYNLSELDWTAMAAAGAIAILGMMILLFRRPAGWGYGIGMLTLALAGIVAHLLLPPVSEHLSAYARLGQLAAYPMLPSLLYRFTLGGAQPVESAAAKLKASSTPAPTVPAPIKTASGMRSQERRRYSASPRTVHSWLELASAEQPEQRITRMAKALGHTMLADLCFVVSGPKFGLIALQSGYDLIREEEMPGVNLEQSSVPSLANALQKGKSLRVTDTDSQPADMQALAAALGLEEAGSLMYIPLSSNEKPHSGLLFLSPYSNRQWMVDDLNYLASELELVADLFHRAELGYDQAATATQLSDRLRSELENARAENQALQQDLEELRRPPQVLAAEGTLAKFQTAPAGPARELAALIELQQETQEQIIALQNENERLQVMLRSKTGDPYTPEDFTRMEEELRMTLQELALQQNELARSNARVLILERDLKLAKTGPEQQSGSNEDRAAITSTVQEIRQPMSSILGYTDLLLAESVGILGALQRKFLERIKASTERMHTLLNDLIVLTAMDGSVPELLPKMVDLGSVIDEAVVNSSAQLREKNIALRVDLPQEIPQISADRDALEQIILHLLQNAGAVTPQEGDIVLRARVQQEEGKDFLLIQVTDSGGGILPENLPRVFARRQRADMPLIQGLGDTGVGLSIARTLVEAHEGRIWVDSQPGEGTTFCVLLPLQSNGSHPVHS